MPITLSDIRNSEKKADRSIIYGVHGIGKTSLAASFPAPIFLQTEDGLGRLNAPTFGTLKTFDQVMEAIAALYSDTHDFQTVALDSLDWLEPIVWTEACRANGWNTIEQPGYGRGYVAALDNWRVLMDGLNALRDDKGMHIVMLAHSEVKTFNSPDSDPYDRYLIKLHKGASALVQENVDNVFFVNYRITTLKTDSGFNKKVVRGVGAGQRVLYTEERPAFVAKNRSNMPESIDLPSDPSAGWSTISPYLNQEQSNG
jgi:hypothetical protein